MERRFEKVGRIKGKEIEMPKRSTKKSAGYDFINPEEERIGAKEIKIVKTGIKAYFEEEEALILLNRSSNAKKKNLVLINGVGLIDSDYVDNEENEGEIGFMFMNIGEEEVIIKEGERLGQGMFIRYEKTEDDRAEGERKGGFGSTGK